MLELVRCVGTWSWLFGESLYARCQKDRCHVVMFFREVSHWHVQTVSTRHTTAGFGLCRVSKTIGCASCTQGCVARKLLRGAPQSHGSGATGFESSDGIRGDWGARRARA